MPSLIHTLIVIIICSVFLVKCELIQSAEGCPAEVCICKWKGGKQTVECVSQSLSNIPEGMDPGTQVLNFTGNSLQVLQSERFLRMDLLNLQKIFLSRNQLIRIHEKAFRGLTNLVELDLSENSLQHIPTETFQDYSSLMRLSLSSNSIRELKSAAFRYLSFLTTLELSNCQIERIENEAFVGMDNLEWLRLDGNRISYIQGNHILPKSLHGVSLQSNRWTCDCRLLDLRGWLNKYHTPQMEEPKCIEPPRLKGQTIKSLKREEFACLPEVSPQSTYTEVSEEHNITISCLVRAIPEPKVLWLFNGQVMSNDTFTDNMHMLYYIDGSSNTSEEKRSEILIYNVGVEDNGTFSCVGQNIAGTTFSNYTIKVMVKEPPAVTEVSLSQNYMHYILASSAGSGVIVVLILSFIIIHCKKRQNRIKRKKFPTSVITSVNVNNTPCSEGTLSNQNGLMKCSSIINDSNCSNGNSDLMISPCETLTPTTLSKENAGTLSNQIKQNIKLYNPLDSSTKTLQFSLNMAPTSSLSSGAPPPPPQSLIVRPAISSALTYCSPPSSLRNYTENPDLVNDTESVYKHKLKTSSSLDTGSSAYESQNECQNLVQYDQYYQLSSPQFGSQILTPNKTATMRFSGMTTLPKGMQLKTAMNSTDVQLNPVCFLGQDTFACEYSHLQQLPQHPPSHHHIMQQQHQIHQERDNLQQQNFYRTLPHNRVRKQQMLSIPNINTAERCSLDTDFLQLHSGTSTSYDKYNVHNIRFTAEGYPQIHLVQHLTPPERYTSSEDQQQHQRQWPPCLPGYHSQPAHYVSTLCQQPEQQPLYSKITTPSALNTNNTEPLTTTSLPSSQTILDAQRKRCAVSQTDSSTIPECDETDILPISSLTVNLRQIKPQKKQETASGPLDSAKKDIKIHHLKSPLGDSGDEGYVGNNQETLIATSYSASLEEM